MNTINQVTDHLPSHTETEVEALRDDIKANGLKVPVVIDDSDTVIDGRLRVRLCDELEIDWRKTTTLESKLTDDQKAALRIRLNLLRRSTPPTASQRREYVKTLLKADPNMSNATFGALCGMDASSVSRIRSQMEKKSEVEAAKSTTGLDGRTRPKVQRISRQEEESQNDGGELKVFPPHEDGQVPPTETTIQNPASESSTSALQTGMSASEAGNQRAAAKALTTGSEGHLDCRSVKLRFIEEVSVQDGSWEWVGEDENANRYQIICRRMVAVTDGTRKIG